MRIGKPNSMRENSFARTGKKTPFYWLFQMDRLVEQQSQANHCLIERKLCQMYTRDSLCFD